MRTEENDFNQEHVKAPVDAVHSDLKRRSVNTSVVKKRVTETVELRPKKTEEDPENLRNKKPN